MRRHELSLFSLVSGIAFAAIAVALLLTDGRFFAYDMHWSGVGVLVAGAVGLLLVVAATSRIAKERREEVAEMTAEN